HELILKEMEARLSNVTAKGLADPLAKQLGELNSHLAAAAGSPEPPRHLRSVVERTAWIYGMLAIAQGPEAAPEMAKLLLAAGPGLGEGAGPWNAVPEGWATELVRSL